VKAACERESNMTAGIATRWWPGCSSPLHQCGPTGDHDHSHQNHWGRDGMGGEACKNAC
jgi:hypothetical protein